MELILPVYFMDSSSIYIHRPTDPRKLFDFKIKSETTM